LGIACGLLERREDAANLVDALSTLVGRKLPSLQTPHASAWDAIFSAAKSGDFLIVTLNNDEKVSGIFGATSYASSTSSEHPDDLFIDELWVFSDAEKKHAPVIPKRGLWIPYSQIKTMEIVSVDNIA
jgi:hypothetical protein